MNWSNIKQLISDSDNLFHIVTEKQLISDSDKKVTKITVLI